MAEISTETVDESLRTICVSHLPSPISAKEITDFFAPFGYVTRLFLKRRVSKDSNVYLKNPRVILIFEKADCVDRIMASRPLSMQDHVLFIRRCLPINPKYPQEAFLSVRKILIHTISETNDNTLPDDKIVVDYLFQFGGQIVFYERLNEKNILVQFDDYDPVDLCCLSRPHFINEQQVEIEKCENEEQIRNDLKSNQKSSGVSSEQFSKSDSVNFTNEPMNTVSTTPILSVEDQMTELRLSFHQATNRLEQQHEQLVAQLTDQWKQTAKQRIRLQRLTCDYKQETERLIQENKLWKKLDNDSLKERTIIQNECEQKLQDISKKNTK